MRFSRFLRELKDIYTEQAANNSMEIIQREQEARSEEWGYVSQSRARASSGNLHEFENIDYCSGSNEEEIADEHKVPPTFPIQINRNPSLTRGETCLEKLKDIGTNLRYNLESFQQNLFGIETNEETAPMLLGKQYHKERIEQLNKDFSKIIWFTYRKNFPKLNFYKASSVESHVSDTGWGCMIRVCQMLFAECLRKSILDDNSPHELSRNESMNSYGVIKEETYLKAKKEMQKEDYKNYLNFKIISWFLDSQVNPKLSPYSIQNISNHISDNYDIQPGVWLKPSVVLLALKKIHEEYNSQTTPDMNMEIFIDGTIFVSQILKSALRKPKKSRRKQSDGHQLEREFEVIEECSTPEKSTLSNLAMRHQNIQKSSESVGEFTFDSSLLFEDSNEIDKLLNQKWNNSVTITVLAKIGLDEPNPEYWPFFQNLLSFPEFIGVIGGRPGFAYYIVGCVGDNLIYLDPHFVQEAVETKEELREKMDTYFCQQIKYIKWNKLDTSVAFSFFIKNEIQFKVFLERLKDSCRKNESFFGLEFCHPQDTPLEFESFDDDEFEMISIK